MFINWMSVIDHIIYLVGGSVLNNTLKKLCSLRSNFTDSLLTGCILYIINPKTTNRKRAVDGELCAVAWAEALYYI